MGYKAKPPTMGIEQELEFRKLEEREKEYLKEYGFYIHYTVSSDDDGPQLINCHTHGLKESFGHDELQVVLPINQRIVSGVIHSAVKLIKNGEKLNDGDKKSHILEGYDVLIKKVIEDGQSVMRLIIPDAAGKFPGDDGCEEYYRDQATFDTRDLL